MSQTDATLAAVPLDAGVLPALARVSRVVSGVVGAGMALVALVTVGAVLTSADQYYWMVVGFEVVVVVACIFAVLTARGKFRDGPGMALVSVAGVLFVAGVLGYLSTKGTDGALMLRGRAFPMKPWALLHAGAAGLMALAAAYEVLRRDRRSLYYLSRAAMAGVPLGAVMAAGWFMWKRSREASAAFDAQVASAIASGVVPPVALDPAVPAWLTWVGASVASVVVLVLFCACAHCLIRAFEMGRPRHSQGATSS